MIRLVYVLLSPTFGMHQYTADLANRMALSGGGEVHLVTTQQFPRDRYAPPVRIHKVAYSTGTGLSWQSLRLGELRQIAAAIVALQPDLVHFTGPHLWNVPLVRYLKRRGIPVIHTIHDLDPHRGTHFGMLLHLWNRLIIHYADQILLHGDQYRGRLLDRGIPPTKVTFTPLMHLFLSHEQALMLNELERGLGPADVRITYEPFVLFFGRLERYKGVAYLLTAFAQARDAASFELVLAGPGKLPAFWAGAPPAGVEVRNRLIGDDEALDLFRRCSLVVLPYVDATQSALIAAAYFFHKPVLVTRAGALAEYVREEETGFVAEPDHPPSMARILVRALTDPAQLQVMGQAGRAWYDKNRAQETIALVALYERHATRQSAPAAAGRQLFVQP
ncbi:MAG: glycosyltransferase family 4 protein [Anaerolineales bacterium]|nr:glycosyltransferase family 4 protein [Anaerolineales bacterium]MCB8950856.1 glycosyltransferase family 4 protein [Ardenticatenales bacterium]